jgi:NAD(P)-dependent dehydrogenase (short-subunit alcohol dehydrogenase family)
MSKLMLITGGSRGIGASVSLLAARQGYDLCVNYLNNAADADKIVKDARQFGVRAMSYKADTSKESDVMAMFEAVDQSLGTVTAVVNNAGITGGFSRVDEVTVETLCRVMNVNVTGCFIVAREAVKRMSTRRGGKGGAIVNVSSGASTTGSPGEYVHYAASKGAIDTMTIGLAREVAGEGIRVNAVNPAIIDTDIHASGGYPDRFKEKGATLPMGRGGTPDEVAAAVLWLLSDESSFTTGACLPLMGGA